MSLKEFLELLRTEGQVIKGAPVAFCSCVLVLITIASIASFYIEERHYVGIIAEKDAAIVAKEATTSTVAAERDSFKNFNEKLSRENDQLRTYRGKDAPPLKQNALILARQIHDFIMNWKDTDAENVKEENVQKFVNRFGLRNQIMRDDLDQNGQQSDAFDHVMYNFSSTYGDVRTIADEIEKLGNKLPN